MPSSPRFRRLPSAGLVVSSMLFACGTETTDGTFPDRSKGADTTTSGGTFGAADPGTAAPGGGSTGTESCSAPVDMFIMFDRSGSMGADGDIGKADSKWTRSVTALSGYFNSQGATAQAAALQFFPIAAQTDEICATGDGYENAASPSAGFTELPSPAFDALLDGTAPAPGLGTPTEPAIRGVTRFTAANRRPGRVTVGILITDGDPTKCNQDLAFLSGLLDAHRTATTIRTYVIGMQGADFANLEEIARGGGAPEHPDVVGGLTDACGGGPGPCRAWNVGSGDPAAFQAALAAIQESADGCKPGGGTANPG